MHIHIYTKIAYSACPFCKKKYSIYFGEIIHSIRGRSGLGPEIVRCESCNATFPSGLFEWSHMTTKQKHHYLFISVLYAFPMGVALSMLVWKIRQYLTGSEDGFLVGAIIFACLVLAFQIFRIFLSQRRTEELLSEPFFVSFTTWQTNFQFYCFVIALFGELFFLFGP